jgi:hypothetical protein
MGLRLIAVALLLWSGAEVRLCAQRPSVAEQYLFQAANAERTQRGLPALRWDTALYSAAYGHAQQMAARASISHQYPGEPELASRGKAAGAKFSVISENVAEAETAVRIHDAWMNSPGHRENLLDPRVDAVGISVLRRDGQLYAVQDFERSVAVLSLEAQEEAVGRLVAAAGPVRILPESDDARRTCALSTGYAGTRQPWFVMRYTSGDLSRIPDTLKAKIASGTFHEATVGACAAAKDQPFSSYSIAVLLYP